MKKINNSIIPIEPDSHKALEQRLKDGGSAKVKLQGSDTVLVMSQTDTQGEYEFTQLSEAVPSDEMRKALEKIRTKF